MAKILVVDDEPMTTRMLATFLEMMGHEAMGAYSSQQAWEKLGSEQPDAILLDIMLPDVNGIDLCRQLRGNAATANVPILMISAIAPPMTKEADEAGANAYLVKPISIQGLKNALASVGISA